MWFSVLTATMVERPGEREHAVAADPAECRLHAHNAAPSRRSAAEAIMPVARTWSPAEHRAGTPRSPARCECEARPRPRPPRAAVQAARPGSPAAAAFINFHMANPQSHAAFAREMGYATTNREGLSLRSQELQHELVSARPCWPRWRPSTALGLKRTGRQRWSAGTTGSRADPGVAGQTEPVMTV